MSIQFRATNDGGKQSKPNLPKPPRKGADTVWVRFAVKNNDCRLVSRYLFEDEERLPSDVGAACFKVILEDANK